MQIDLMISGNQPIKAMTCICDLTLFWIVFSLPPKCEPTVSEGCDRYDQFNIIIYHKGWFCYFIGNRNSTVKSCRSLGKINLKC